MFLLGVGLLCRSAAQPALAQEAGQPPFPTLSIAAPANGALVEGSFIVKFALKDKDSGAPPSGDPARDAVPPPPGAGGRPAEGPRGRYPKICLLIDTPLPEIGRVVYADGGHMPFPAGENQLAVSLRPGRHRLQIILLEHDGRVGQTLVTSPSVMVEAQ